MSVKLPTLPGLLWIVALWALFYAFQSTYGQTDTAMPDTRVVIDVSGSMKKTDPQNLRVPAVKLLLNLAKDKSRFGVWSFGQQVNNLVPVAGVSPEWKKASSGAADAIHSRGLFTNIGAALEAAAMGQTKPDPAWDRTIVLLSDGMVDISKDPAVNAKEKTRILETLVPKLRVAGFHIRTVALSEAADQAFLKTLALQTQGSFVLARNADELLKAFVETSDKVNLPEQVPLNGDSFSIDESVKEFTALIFRKSDMKDTRLKAPDGQEFSLAKGSRNVSWFADKKYDLITVYNPVPGKWKIIADLDPGNRVTVVSDLQLEVQGLPDNVLEGEKVTMNMFLAEHGRAIANPNFLELMDITFTQETDKGESFEGKLSQDGDGKPRVPGDGIYTAKLGRTLVEGEHTFTVLVDGKTFKRKKIHKMAVYRDVMDVRTDYRDENGQVIQFLVASPRPGMANPENLELIAQIQNPNGEKSIQTATMQADGRLKIEVPPNGVLGNYDILLKVKGVSAHGDAFELVQGPYSIDYTPLGMTDTLAPKPATSEPAIPPVTFDPGAMDIPSLDVEELPPEDMLPLPEPRHEDVALMDTPAPVMDPAADPLEADPVEEESNWIMLASLFALGNVAILVAGVFFYLKFLKKTDAEQARVVDEIAQLKQRQKEEKLKAAAEAAAAPVAAVKAEADIAMDVPGDEVLEEATMLRTSLPEPAPAPVAPAEVPAPIEAAVPPAVPEPEQTYINQAAPLDLDDDEMVEIDDFDDEFADEMPEEVDNLDDLDMMLNEQEDVGSDTQINQAIDDMLEQPTVFPDKKKAVNDDANHFADDEFMLDNPETKT